MSHRTVDITTTGRRTGQPRRIEIWMWELGDRRYISGWPDLPRGWYANLLSRAEFTLHLKDGPERAVRARPITDPTERRAVIERFGGALGDPETLVAGAPLIEVLAAD